MHPHQPSRRRLLAGVLASVLGWLGIIGRTKADAPPPRNAPARPDGRPRVVVTVHFTDRHGQRRQVSYEYPDPYPPPVCSYMADGGTGLTVITQPG
jgi:hypothetical protein